jgi:U3 small nucleolar RNA-associated protein 13
MNQPRRLLNLFTEVRLTSGSSSSDPSANAADLLSHTGSRHVDIVLQKLSPNELRQLLGYIRDWNTVARSAETAQAVLHAILKFHDADEILATLEGKAKGQEVESEEEEESEEDEEESAEDRKRRKRKQKRAEPPKAHEILGALIPYTERHMARADKLVRESFIVEHLLGMMEGFDDFDVTEKTDEMDVEA